MSFPVSFDGFTGNRTAINHLRAAVAAGRLPHSMILAGARGSGKYTLALLLTLALECERQPREQGENGRALASFCGYCRNCKRIAEAADLEAKVAEAVSTREDIDRDADKRDTRVLIQTHPDVLIVPPDPPQLLIKLGQIRTLIHRAQRLPTEAPARVFLLTSSAMMKEAANSLLKILEEPPHSVHILLLAENAGELLPTLRSRCAMVRLGALPHGEIEALLTDRRPEWSPAHRALVARLSEGAPGRALGFQLEEYLAARADALVLLSSAEGSADYSTLFRATEAYRAGADGQAKTTALLRALARLLEDILLLQGGAPDRIGNIDRRSDLERFAANFSFHWLESALHGMDAVYAGLRRNLLRSLSLDALAVELEAANP